MADLDMKELPKVVVPQTDALIPILTAAGSAVQALFTIVKFEIIRDFFQFVGLIFEGLWTVLPASVRDAWGSFMSAISFCFSCWVEATYEEYENTISAIVFSVEVGLAVIFSIVFFCIYAKYNPDEDVHGLESIGWSQRSKRTRSIAKWTMLLLTTIYLPLCRDITQVLSCDLKFAEHGTDCATGRMLVFKIMAAITILIYIIPIPLLFARIVFIYRPQPRIFDAEGKLRLGEKAYTNADYRLDLSKDQNPFNTLYCPYERNWAYFKSIIMGMKLALAVSISLLTVSSGLGGRERGHDHPDANENVLLYQSIAVLAVMGVYAVVAWCSRPFLDGFDDVIDGISRGTCLVVAVVGLISWWYDSSVFMGVTLNVATTITVISLITFILFHWKRCRKCCRSCTQTVSLTMSRAEPDTARLLHLPTLDLAKERKLRLWHEFWDSLFAQQEDLRCPPDADYKKKADKLRAQGKDDEIPPFKKRHLDYQRGITPPYLRDFGGTVEERHMENKEIAAACSLASYEAGLCVNTPASKQELTQLMMSVLNELNGVDVYWPGPIEGAPIGTEDGMRKRTLVPQGPSSYFGRLYCNPFPFTAVLTMDSSNDRRHVFSWAPVVSGIARDPQQSIQHLRQLVELNRREDVLRKKTVRQDLRALDGQSVKYYHQQRKTKTYSVGSGKNRRTKSVSVLFTFNNGVFRVKSNHSGGIMWKDDQGDLTMDVGNGFNPTIHYNDGYGSAAGRTWRNEPLTISGPAFGVGPEFLVTPNLKRLMDENFNKVLGGRGAVQAKLIAYRNYYKRKFNAKDAALSYSFWYYIYNNDRIPHKEMVSVLQNRERQMIMQRLPAQYDYAFRNLYARVKHFDESPANGYWFSFWHDVWVNNKDMVQQVGDHPELFSPYESKSLCFRRVGRDELERTLQEVQFGGGPRGCCGMRGNWINSDMIDQLYANMETIATASSEQKQQAQAVAISIPTANDLTAARSLVSQQDTTLSLDRDGNVQISGKQGGGGSMLRTQTFKIDYKNTSLAPNPVDPENDAKMPLGDEKQPQQQQPPPPQYQPHQQEPQQPQHPGAPTQPNYQQQQFQQPPPPSYQPQNVQGYSVQPQQYIQQGAPPQQPFQGGAPQQPFQGGAPQQPFQGGPHGMPMQPLGR